MTASVLRQREVLLARALSHAGPGVSHRGAFEREVYGRAFRHVRPFPFEAGPGAATALSSDRSWSIDGRTSVTAVTRPGPACRWHGWMSGFRGPSNVGFCRGCAAVGGAEHRPRIHRLAAERTQAAALAGTPCSMTRRPSLLRCRTRTGAYCRQPPDLPLTKTVVHAMFHLGRPSRGARLL